MLLVCGILIQLKKTGKQTFICFFMTVNVYEGDGAIFKNSNCFMLSWGLSLQQFFIKLDSQRVIIFFYVEIRNRKKSKIVKRLKNVLVDYEELKSTTYTLYWWIIAFETGVT